MDVVDESDRVIGQKKGSELYAQKSPNCRVINAFSYRKWIVWKSAHYE